MIHPRSDHSAFYSFSLLFSRRRPPFAAGSSAAGRGRDQVAATRRSSGAAPDTGATPLPNCRHASGQRSLRGSQGAWAGSESYGSQSRPEPQSCGDLRCRRAARKRDVALDRAGRAPRGSASSRRISRLMRHAPRSSLPRRSPRCPRLLRPRRLAAMSIARRSLLRRRPQWSEPRRLRRWSEPRRRRSLTALQGRSPGRFHPAQGPRCG